jgi:hypothetical protein
LRCVAAAICSAKRQEALYSVKPFSDNLTKNRRRYDAVKIVAGTIALRGLTCHIALLFFTVFAILSFAGGASGRDFSGVKGNWVCQNKCGCGPASPHRYASISASGTVRNECGMDSSLVLTNNRLQAKDWPGGPGGTISLDAGLLLTGYLEGGPEMRLSF